ncbi:MAG: acetolactate synthase [Anaerolineae bacterium]|nr:MAG: acetolactate synthase [Anaerolineae bacterium]
MTYAHGGELVARSLATQGVSTIYTLCGGHVAPIYDGCLNHDIAVIDFRHEQAAAHAADAHARLTRNVGVALVTAGPGVTDAVTGVANAYQARSPMILLGGAAPLKTKGMGALQEMPQVEMFRTFTKAAFTIERTEDIPERMAEAYRHALSGRPGPVFVELPFDVLFNAVDSPERMPERVTIDPVAPPVDAVQAMFELLRAAERPLIIAGTQVYWDDAGAALRELTDQTAIPVFTNGAGRGTLPMDHPHCFKATRGKALRVNHNRQAEVAITADARLVLEALAEGLQGIRFQSWLEQVAGWERARNEKQAAWEALGDVPVNHFRFAAEVERFIDEDTIVIGDGGDIVSACAKVLTITRPGQWLDPGPLGCLGVGAPFAVAAQHLYPDRRVLIISGDGSFGLNGFEFDTAVRFGLPIVAIVGNDAGWGQIRGPQMQMVGKDRAIATSLAPTRYDRVVEALGGHGELVEEPDGILPALEQAFAGGRPACVNVTLDPEGMSKTGASSPYIV